ncbi:MAG: U32 family peptidase [Bacilli bacterium]|nr:U32 family peptidase [Bacilli bacterium]
MKLLIEKIDNNFKNLNVDGIILALKDLSIQSIKYYSIDEIKSIKEEYPNLEIFIKINKNIMNKDLDLLKESLIELDKLNINGVFFYDLAFLQLKKELNLSIDLVWDQTHMVNNYKTCDYYNSLGVKYALLSKEITLNEIKTIIEKSKITSMVEVVSVPSIAFSKRKLLTSYFKNINKELKEEIEVIEKVSNNKYIVMEDNNGTSFYDANIVNGTSLIKDLYEMNCPYIIMREYKIPKFDELVNDTKEYIDNKCIDTKYIDKYKVLGDNTNFFYKETIYRVKKNEK